MLADDQAPLLKTPPLSVLLTSSWISEHLQRHLAQKLLQCSEKESYSLNLGVWLHLRDQDRSRTEPRLIRLRCTGLPDI